MHNMYVHIAPQEQIDVCMSSPAGDNFSGCISSNDTFNNDNDNTNDNNNNINADNSNNNNNTNNDNNVCVHVCIYIYIYTHILSVFIISNRKISN